MNEYDDEQDSQQDLDDEINREIADIVAEDQHDHQNRNEMAIQDNDEDEEDGDDQISPNLIAMAQQLGYELNPEQIQNLQKMMEAQYQGTEEFDD